MKHQQPDDPPPEQSARLESEPGCTCMNCRLARTEAKVDIVLRLVRKVNMQTARNLNDLTEGEK